MIQTRSGTSGWKLIVREEEGRENEFEVYDLSADPGELINVSEKNPDVTKRLAKALAKAEAAGRTQF